MAIVSGDIQYRLSGGAANSDAALSYGGAMSSVSAPSTLFSNVSSSQASAGLIDYRCIYVRNNHGSLTLEDPVLWISVNTPSTDTTVAVGLGAAAVNATEDATAGVTTAPAGVSFSSPSSFGAGIAMADLPAGQHKAIWIRRTVTAGAAAYSNDGFTIVVRGDTAA